MLSVPATNNRMAANMARPAPLTVDLLSWAAASSRRPLVANAAFDAGAAPPAWAGTRNPGSAGRCAVGDHEPVAGLNAARRDRGIPVQELRDHVSLGVAGDQPEDLASGCEDRIGERHPASALVLAAGEGHAAVGDLEHRVAWNERGGVPVGAQPKMDEVEGMR